MLLGITACTTKPLPAPMVCLEECRVNSCTLSDSYDGKDEEGRATEELTCAAENASEARMCAKLKALCAAELKAR